MAPVVIDTSDPTIRLTPDNLTFVTAHRGLLIADSDYFAAYFGRSRTSHKKYVYGASTDALTISFKDCADCNTPSLEVLKMFTQWLYTRAILLPIENKFEGLARAYIFGEKVMHKPFCDAVMDIFIDLHVSKRKTCFEDVIPLVYDHTWEKSPLRKVLADIYAWNLEDGAEDGLGELPKEFLMDVLAAMVKVRKPHSEGWWGHLDWAYDRYYVDDDTKETVKV